MQIDKAADSIFIQAENLDLYHRTSPEAAEAIYNGSPMRSKENTGETYWSTHPGSDSEATGFGDTKVHIRVPEEIAELDDEFPSGEQHYRVHPSNIRPEHFVKDSSQKVSEADVHDGAMVALMPASEFIDELAIGGYEPVDQLHVTLLYLGKQASWSECDRRQLRQFIGHYFVNCVQIHAEIRAHAVFNPGSDEAASVYLIGGQGALTCEDFAKLLRSEVDSGKYAVEVPNDYPFYLPHLTIGYDLSVDKLTYIGPIVFDTVRIVFGGDSTDISLRPLEDSDGED